MSEKELVDSTIQASREHQNALRQYAERLEAELNAVDKMIVSPFSHPTVMFVTNSS